MIVITGRQRSGTTVLARMFAREGVGLGTTWTDEVGGFESETTSAFFRRYLGDETFPFTNRNWPEIATPGDFAQMEYKAIKWSFLLMNPVFVHIWYKFRGNKDQLLICVRDPREIVGSKAARWDVFGNDSRLLDQTPGALNWNFSTSIKVATSYGFDMQFLGFPAFLHSRTWVNYALHQLGADFAISKEVWDATVDLNKVHTY